MYVPTHICVHVSVCMYNQRVVHSFTGNISSWILLHHVSGGWVLRALDYKSVTHLGSMLLLAIDH